VIKETLRIANVVDFSYREALEDIAYNGNTFFSTNKFEILDIYIDPNK
jgi:hypothetical protein